MPKPKETEFDLEELPTEKPEFDTNVELSEEDAAERDRRDQALREADEQADFKRQTQVIQKGLPRPSVVDIDSLLQAASKISDPIQRAIETEMALLIYNDAVKYPLPNQIIRGSAKPLEQFDDKSLNKARLEIMREMIPQDILKKHQDSFDTACDKLYASSKHTGLVAYEDSDTDEPQLMLDAFDVSLLHLHPSLSLPHPKLSFSFSPKKPPYFHQPP